MQLHKGDRAYSCGDISVSLFPDQDNLARIYLAAKEQGLLKLFFYLDRKPLELNQWLAWAMAPRTVTFGAYLRKDFTGATKIIGIGKIGLPQSMGFVGENEFFKSEVSMLFLREYQYRQFTITACQIMLQMHFDACEKDPYAPKVLFGTTPERNRASLRFMKAIGFNHTKEPIPQFVAFQGGLCGVYVSQMSHERWIEISPFQ